MMQAMERIRKLQNRMRKPTKNSPTGSNLNEQSLRSIKSTDSQKMKQMNLKKMIINQQEESKSDENRHDASRHEIKLTQEQMKQNKKITDYFLLKVSDQKKPAKIQNIQSPPTQKKKIISPKSQLQTSTFDPETVQSIKEQNKNLKEKLKIKEENMVQFKIQMKKDMLENIMKVHKMKRNQMRLRVSNNKIRLGEYYTQKKGQEMWIDGTEIRQIKEKLQQIAKDKEQLEKNKKNASRKYVDDQERKNALISQMYFLTREQAHYQEILKRLQQQKALHIKQFKLLFEQERSRYGKIDSQTGVTNWPQIKQYQLMGLLGKGGFSQVYKAYDTQQFREVAVKVHQFNCSWNDNAKDNYIKHALRENKVHKQLIHPNIVRLYDTVQIDSTSFCTVLQYCEGPDLSFYLKKHKKLPQKEAKLIIRQVIMAIKYLHELPDKVIHYDLKPQNILFSKGRIKITDFGLCKTTKQQVIQLTSQGVGTYWYLPPECFFTDQKVVISTKVDIWSIGVIYYQMLFGQKPFGSNMSQVRILNQGIILKATKVQFPPVPKGCITNQSKQFIKACLTFSPEQRIDIYGVLNNPLFDKK